MEYNKPIADMLPGMDVEGFYILRAAALKTTNSGKPFLSGTICDRTGSVEIKLWDYSGPIGARPEDTGRVVKIRGSVSEYRGALQISVHRIRMAEAADDYDTSLLVPTAPIDTDAVLADVQRLVASITDADYRSVAETMLTRHLDAFRRIPAGKSVHHSFLSGLLMHTYNMLRTADFLAGLYPEVIDRSLLLTGTLLHDFGKEREFAFSDLGIVTEYSTAGQLLGHLVMGAQEVADAARAWYSRGKVHAAAAPAALAPRRAGVRRGRAAHVRRGGAAVVHRPHRQPHGDLCGNAPGRAGRQLQRPHFCAGKEDLSS